MIRYNRKELRDKIYACWLGKNIGGTIGTPFEGQRQINDVKGFNSPPGNPLPNDDLDLQLVWLRAMDEQGPDKIDNKLLGQYWMNYIGPHWNEYGVCKSNMRSGFLPPMSGSFQNERWMHSNGAWIRTEIWACTHPATVEKAIRLSFADASVDHGFGEGSYGAIFVAAMESAAFMIRDLDTLIKIGLSKIPENCRVARSVRLVCDCYRRGVDWKDTRNAVVHDNEDLGWFQAPANIAFAILGLLYGEGDFKKSVLLAVDCGDDTDCTGATVGALLGIMHGTKIIPEDWAAYIGESIVTVAIIRGIGYFPATCNELTDAVMHLIPACTRTPLPELASKGPWFTITDEETSFGELNAESFMGDDFCKRTFSRSPWSVEFENILYTVVAGFDREPVIAPNGEIKVRLSVHMKPNCPQQNHFYIRWLLPEGFRAEGPSNLYAPEYYTVEPLPRDSVEVKLIAGESVAPQNRVLCEISSPDQLIPTYIPLMILG